MNKKGKILTWLAIMICTAFILAAIVNDFIKDRAISANPAIKEAKIVDIQTHTKRKRGITRKSYDFTYEFEVDGKKYRGEFGASQNHAKPYLDGGVVSIMYNKDKPQLNDLRKNVATDRTFMDLFWGFIKSILFGLLMGLLIGVVVSYKLGWLKKTENIKKEGNSSRPEIAEA